MVSKFYTTSLLICTLLISSCGHHKNKKKDKAPEIAGVDVPVSSENLSKTIETWPDVSKAATNSMAAKYGLPSSISSDMIVWSNTAPFKRTIVHRDPVIHRFPVEHSDVLEQVVDYRVPVDKVGALAKFNGSLSVDRTLGELSSRCDKEAMNFLSLNLADKIIRGALTPDQARQEYANSVMAFSIGNSNEYLTGLNFRMRGNTTDPDQEISGSSFKRTIEAQEVREIEESQFED